MKIHLVKYIEDNTIEGYVTEIIDFHKWLEARNKEREKNGDLIELASEFCLTELSQLK